MRLSSHLSRNFVDPAFLCISHHIPLSPVQIVSPFLVFVSFFAHFLAFFSLFFMSDFSLPMPKSSSVKVIVVGCGKWGRNLNKTLFSLSRLAAIVDESSEAIASFKSEFRYSNSIPAYTSFQTALERHPKSAVAIATPPATHFNLASHAIHANRSVFVEKPMCTSYREAQTLVEMAKNRGVILMTDHLLQYSLRHRELIHLVHTGMVGTVNRVRMTRANFGTVRTGENVLWSFSPHDLSILLALVPYQNIENATVACRGQAVVSSSVEDYVDLSISLGKVQAQIEVSWLHPLKERRVVVYGTEGAVVLNETGSHPRLAKLQAFKWTAKRTADGSAVVARKTDNDVENHLYLHDSESECAFSDDTEPLKAALEHFIHCVSTKTPPRTDGSEALRVLALLETATESLQRDGKTVKVGDHCKGIKSQVEDTIDSSSTKSLIHPSAVIDKGAVIGSNTRIWHFCHVMGGAVIGQGCSLGQNVFVGDNVVLGNDVKVQNNVSLYDAVTIADNVFLGPSCVFTNVKNPRAFISRKHAFSKTKIDYGATIGANATIVCGVTLGKFCFIGAGAVVTKDVPPYALFHGNPATLQGWVSTTGIRLRTKMTNRDGSVLMTCPETHQNYTLYERGKDGHSDPTLVPEE